MNRKNIIIFCSLVLFANALLLSCNAVSKRIGWSCINTSNELDCKYQLFSGQETEGIFLETGETLEIKYDVQVEAGGIGVYIQSPSGETIWETDLIQTASEEIEFQAAESGNYRLIVEGRETRGAFKIHW
jgi:hypothetical protein